MRTVAFPQARAAHTTPDPLLRAIPVGYGAAVSSASSAEGEGDAHQQGGGGEHGGGSQDQPVPDGAIR